MLRLDRQSNAFRQMQRRSLSEAGLMERYDLQRLICATPALFFTELGEELLLVGQEIQPADIVDDRIDVLAVDQEGTAVVIELKRGHHAYQLLQGLSYAAMISGWSPEELIETYRTTAGLTAAGARERVEDFLKVDPADLNKRQRVILVAEEFDYEVLATARWLGQMGGIDVRCYRLVLSADDVSEILSCTCVYPVAELEDHARKRSRRADSCAQWPDWETALANVTNAAVRDFVLAELSSGQVEPNLNKRTINYRLRGTRRFHVGARNDRVYVWQAGRFADDERFWTTRLGSSAQVEPIKDDGALRFYLHSPQDFAAFRQAVSTELVKADFVESAADLPPADPPLDSPETP